MTSNPFALSSRWTTNARLLNLLKMVVPDYSQSIRCHVCGQPIGAKGSTPARAVTRQRETVYVHEGCK